MDISWGIGTKLIFSVGVIVLLFAVLFIMLKIFEANWSKYGGGIILNYEATRKHYIQLMWFLLILAGVGAIIFIFG